MFKLTPTTQFKKDFKLIKKRSETDTVSLTSFLKLLEKDGVAGIDQKYRPHKLSGKYKGDWEAHVKPDLLIIWFEVTADNEIILLRVGSHSDLF